MTGVEHHRTITTYTAGSRLAATPYVCKSVDGLRLVTLDLRRKLFLELAEDIKQLVKSRIEKTNYVQRLLSNHVIRLFTGLQILHYQFPATQLEDNNSLILRINRFLP